jgi:predicted MFS family arabinose efflux permease
LSRTTALAATAYAFAVTMLGTTLPTPLYALYRERFGFSQLMITVIFATYAVGVISALLLFGRLSDDIGRRRALLPGLVLSALSAVAFLLLHGLGLILLGRVLSGLSAGIFTGTATAAITDLAGEGGAARATLVATLANIGGLGCGPLLAGILAEWAPDPLRLVFIVDLALLAIAFVLVWRTPERVADPDYRLRLQRPGVPDQARAVFVPASLAGFAGFSVLGLFTAVAPAFLATILGVTNLAAIGLIVFAVFASSAAGQVLAGSVAQRLALVGGCATLAAGVAVLGTSLAASSLVLLIAGGLLAGLGQGMSFRASLGAVAGAAPADRRGETSSAFFVVAYVAISLPVVGVGALAQATTLRTAGLVFSAIVVVIAATASALLAAITRR